MASIAKRPNGQWRARYQAPDGKWHARHFRRKVDGQRWLDEQTTGRVSGTYVDPTAGKITFSEYAEQWRVGQVHRETTRAQVEGSLRRHAYPAIGGQPLNSILPSDIQAWVRRMSEQLEPRTVGMIHGVVSGIFRAAVRDRRIVANPCEGTKLRKVTPARIKPLSTEVVERMIEAIAPRWRAFLITAAGTGLRQGELLGITVDRVDFLRRSLRVDRQLITTTGAPQLTPPKTAVSVRTVTVAGRSGRGFSSPLSEFSSRPNGIDLHR